MRLWVGTSGFHYDHWRGAFYPAGLPTDRWLAFYAQRFATVELNAPFYRLPPVSTFERWASLVPAHFRFAVKVSRYLSHVLRLVRPEEPVQRMLERCAGLGDRLGPLLLQLPPDMQADPERLSEVLALLAPHARVAVEPRHPSWWTERIAAVLREHGATLCWADRRGAIAPTWVPSPWRYVRYHEGRGAPRPCYRPDELTPWVRRLAAEAERTDDAWVYFNNDGRGCAIADATSFMRQARDAGIEVMRAEMEPSVPGPASAGAVRAT
jgi:uncharacterized protein YecE (DUF72 family)